MVKESEMDNTLQSTSVSTHNDNIILKKTAPKVIIVDDHMLFREGMKLLVETEGLGEVVAEAENGQIFLDLLAVISPDLVLMDLEMPVMGGLEATKKALLLKPDLKIIALTMLSERDYYTDMIRAGAMGFVLKTSGKQVLENAIKTVIGGESYFSEELLYRIASKSGQTKPDIRGHSRMSVPFTDKEREVLHCLCTGLSANEIACKLCKSLKTIEAHRAKLLQKTDTKNTINLVLYSIRNNLVEI
jgi:DNA-binding NarL/FixJ family response regulator